MIYLIDYDWRAGHLFAMTVFKDSERGAAEQERMTLELRMLDEGLDREVVLLEAQDEAGLRRTHSRYFKSLEELLGQSAERRC